jgi:hypothetical protein
MKDRKPRNRKKRKPVNLRKSSRMPKAKTNKEIKLVKKSKILLLTVRCTDEYFNDCNFAAFKLSKKVLDKIKEVKSIREIVSSSEGLYKLSYWNPFGFGTFDFLEDNTDISEELTDEAMNHSDGGVQYLNAMPEAKGDLRVECEMLHVYSDGIRFEGYVKNTNTKLETDQLSWAELGIK